MNLAGRWIIGIAVLYCLTEALVCVLGELPEGMHQATLEIRVDTVAFRPVPRYTLDSADSAWLLKARQEQFDKRRMKK